MIKVGICDDEYQFRYTIRKNIEFLLNEYKVEYEVHEYSSGEQLIEEYRSLQILILDIRMKNIDGMSTAKHIRKVDMDVKIIFMTSFIEFMQQGYEVRAYRYLLKPVDSKQLKKHVGSCLDEIIKNNNNYLSINNKNYIDRVKVESILYIETNRPNLLIHTRAKTYCIKSSLNKFEKILKENNFFRCHNSYLVNIKEIKSMDGESIIINNDKIPVSKYRKKELKLIMTEVLGDMIC